MLASANRKAGFDAPRRRGREGRGATLRIPKREYIFSNDTGDAALTAYEVLPGIQLVYSSVHMDQFDLGRVTAGNMIELHYCLEGRIQQTFEDQSFYLTPGDLSIALRTEMVQTYHFPLRHYHGITIGINEEMARQSLSRIMEDVSILPLEVAGRLCGGSGCHILRSEPAVAHIFAQMSSVPEDIQKGYFKLKIMELLLMLSRVDPSRTPPPPRPLPRSQVQLANRVASYLSEHMDDHVTIARLAKEFNASETHLKTVFRGVYGVPIFTYTRLQKMQSAAYLLIHTERPVADIAGQFGYGNTGKFIAAFKQLMGETPTEYRRAHTRPAAV